MNTWTKSRIGVEHTMSGLSDASEVVTSRFSSAMCTFESHSILVQRKFEVDCFRSFIKLKDRWLEETKYLSNPSKIYSNSNYIKILMLGYPAAIWIIRELKKDPDHWFHALTTITGVNPIKDEHAGHLMLMRQDWLEWAKNNAVE